jgi:hypothetical protein
MKGVGVGGGFDTVPVSARTHQRNLAKGTHQLLAQVPASTILHTDTPPQPNSLPHAPRQRHYKRSGNLPRCVAAAGLKWEGRAHSGLDDARNEARLAAHLMCRGVRFAVSGSFPHDAPHSALAPAATGGETGGGAQSTAGGSASTGAPGDGRSRQRQVLLAPLGTAGSGQVATHDRTGKWLGVCKCGVKAAPRVTKKPGPNHGRSFFSCGRWRMVTRGDRQPCDFFQWADDK